MSSAQPSAISRANRASTLPSQAGADTMKHGRPLADVHNHHHHYRHHISHRHHKSHHQSSREPQSAIQPPSATDLFSPVKSAADGIRELGNKSAGAFSETAFGKYPSLQKDRDREQREEVQQDEQQDDEQRMKRKATENATWEDVRKAKEANDKQEAELSSQLSGLSTRVLDSASSLARSHAELQSSISSSYSTIGKLSVLLNDTSSLFTSFTTSSIPEIEDSTRAQLQALEQTYTQVEKERLLGLEQRLTIARDKVDGLMGRLAAAKKDVEAEETREMEERRRHKRTVGIAWGTLGFGLLVFVALLGWHRSGASMRLQEVKGHERHQLKERLKERGVEWVLGEDENPSSGFESIKQKYVTRSKSSSTRSLGGKGATTTTMLARLLDEL